MLLKNMDRLWVYKVEYRHYRKEYSASSNIMQQQGVRGIIATIFVGSNILSN